MVTLGVIPARYASTRFPGKPLIDIAGKSMIRRVYEQAKAAGMLDAVVVATDDQRIFDHVQAFGGQAVMTREDHLSGTDRCAEVAQQFMDSQWIVNIQGDEPFIDPDHIDLLVTTLQGNVDITIATLMQPITDMALVHNPNVVKVIADIQGHALYFSRSPIPYIRSGAWDGAVQSGHFHRHLGLYGFKREALLAVTQLSPGRLEQLESLEQLRWLEQGFSIGLATVDTASPGIDVPEDVARAIAWAEKR